LTAQIFPMTDFRFRHAQFERLVRPHFDRLYRIAIQLTGNAASADDIVQDALIKIFRKVDTLESITPLEPWLVRVVYNTYIDYYRKQKRAEGIFETGRSADEAGTGSDINRLGDLDALTRALSALSPDHRAVVVLHDVQGYALVEIGALLDCPVGTLKSRLHRARAALRDLLALEPDTRFVRNTRAGGEYDAM